MIAGNYFSVVILAVWLGFVLSISFMESWLKFRAKGVTTAVALSIGKLIFTALNLVEWLAAAILAGLYFIGNAFGPVNLPPLYWGLIVILIIQTFYLLPLLGRRASRVIAGESLQPSRAHLWYILGETLKVSLLIASIISMS